MPGRARATFAKRAIKLLGQYAAKFTLDAIWYFDDPNDTTMLGFGSDIGTARLLASDADQISIRMQFQINF